MFTCKSYAILTLMFVMTLLIIHLADGQSDVYQYAQKRQQPNVPLKYCGKYLSTTLQFVCNGVYNSMFKKSDRGMSNKFIIIKL